MFTSNKPCKVIEIPIVNKINVVSSDCIQYQRTIASWCPPTPMSIGHAGTSAVSLQGVPSVTGVGHCGLKGCTRATLLTIFRSIRGRTTADCCREDTGTTFFLTIMQSNANQHKIKGGCSQTSSSEL